MKPSKKTIFFSSLQEWSWPLLVAIPLIIGFSWGAQFIEQVYVNVRYALNLASGLGLSYSPISITNFPNLSSLLYVGVLSFFIRLGLDIPQSTAFLSLLGWSAAAISFITLGSKWNLSLGSLISAVLLTFNPWVIASLGEPTSWVIALFWISFTLIIHHRYLAGLISILLLIASLFPWPIFLPWSYLNAYYPPFLWSTVIFSAGTGTQWAVKLLAEKELLQTPYQQTVRIFLLIAAILCGTVQFFALWQQFQDRPEAKWLLENDIGLWLKTETTPQDKILTSEKIGFLAQRQVITPKQLGIFDEKGLQETNLRKFLPDYLVTDQSLGWQNEFFSNWFQLNYEQTKIFSAPDVTKGPYTIWLHRPPLNDLEPLNVLNARIPDRLRILGYQIDPGIAQPGQAVRLALYLQALNASLQPQSSFLAIVRLIATFDKSTQTEWKITLPQSLLPDQWQPDQVITEDLLLSLPEHLDPGAYQFNISLLGENSEELWPISFDNDINRLDRLTLGNVVIPWTGDVDQMHPLTTNFENKMMLIGYEISDFSNDGTVSVTLYWQSDGVFEDDYTVFVHLLDKEGNLVANHDGQPAGGRFPTTSWRKGLIIHDEHSLQLPEDLAANEYQLFVGLYLPETGERLQIIEGGSGDSIGDAQLLERLTLP